MSELEFQGIERLFFGVDSIERVADVVKPLGKRVLLVTEQSGKDKDSFVRLQSILHNGGLDPVVFDDIRPGIKTSVIETIADIGKAGKIQVVVAMGGMRVLSVARVASVIIGSEIGLSEALRGKLPRQVDCSYVEVPNSCRNHFMMKDSCVISDSVNERARYIPLPSGMTKAVIIDPGLSMGLSSKYQLVAILDTMLASIEGYLSVKRNFLSDIHLIEAMGRLRRALGITMRRPEDIAARQQASEGGVLSAMGLATSSQGIGGTLAYMINAAFQAPKSWIATVLLPHILDMYEEREPVRLARIADALGEDISGLESEKAAPMAARAVRRILAQLELPTRLRDFNLSLSDVSAICAASAEFPLNQHCGLSLSSEEVCELIKKAF
jgi:alcohol dehydrogenase class IV